jgi:hypothetical protein
MSIILLGVMITAATMATVIGGPEHIATWIISILMVVGVFTSPGMGMRLVFVLVALFAPVIRIVLRTTWALTVYPVVYYFRHRFDAHRTVDPLAADHPLSVKAAPHLDAPVRDALALGFRSRGRVVLPVGSRSVVSEFLDRDEGRLWVSVNVIVGGTEDSIVMDCSAKLVSGEVITVTNYAKVSSMASVPGFLNWRLPSLSRVGGLIRACERLAEQRGAIIPVPLVSDVAALARARTRERIEADRQAGYHRYDASADVYRPTLKGAYRLLWVMLPPLNGFIDRRDRERERAILAELGITPQVESSPPITLIGEYRKNVPGIALLIAFALFGPEIPKWIVGLLF